ncbi:MAG: hypothetical protein WCX74_02125 [Candidatus Paceibacterota bacterium]
MIKKYIKENQVLLSTALLLTAIDILSTILGLGFEGGYENFEIAKIFLQYGFFSFIAYMIVSRILLFLFIIYTEQILLFLLKKAASQKEFFAFIKYIFSGLLLAINAIWLIIAMNNINQLMIIFS